MSSFQKQIEVQKKAEKALEEAFAFIGNNGRYQKKVIVTMSLAWVAITYGVMINSFVFMNPLFTCEGQNTSELIACQKIENCEVINDFTGTYYAHLYCEQKTTRSFIQSSYAVGCLIGVMCFSVLNDTKGRKFSALICSGLGLAGIIAIFFGILQKTIPLIILGQIFSGVFGSAAVTSSFIITGQIGSNSLRQKAIMVYSAVWGATQLTFIFIQEHFEEWNVYLLAFNLIPLLFLNPLLSKNIVETPSFYLINEKNLKKCQQSLTKMGKINSASQDKIKEAHKVIENFWDAEIQMPSKKAEREESMSNIFAQIIRNSQHLKTLLCLGFLSMGFNVFYYGLLSSLERTGHSFGLNVFLIGLHQFVGYSIIGFFITKIKRVKGLFIVNTVLSVLGMSFILPSVSEDPTTQSFIISLCTLSFVAMYSFAQMLNMQSFNPQIKSTAVGFISAMSQICRFFIPFILTAMNDIGMNPIIAVTGLFSMMGLIPLFFIKETYSEIKTKQS